MSRYRALCALLALLMLLGTPPAKAAASDPTLALMPFLSGEYDITALAPLAAADGDILRYQVTLTRGEARAWVFPDGGVFWCERSTAPFTLRMRGFQEVFAVRLKATEARSPRLIENGQRSLLIQPPLARNPGTLDGANYNARDWENGLVTLDHGTVKVTSTSRCADWWAYLSPTAAAAESGDRSWLYACTVDKFGADNRMTLDGYYYVTPSDYYPSGLGCYYLNAAAYIPGKLARYNTTRYGRQIAVAMLDLQREHYNAAGFVPTAAMSGWLSRDYRVGAGFFDTRFNTELAHALLTLGRDLGIREFETHALTYSVYLVSHAASHSTRTVSGGLLVQDYAHPAGNLPTNMSLNHQLAELLFLTDVGTSQALLTARQMLRGIEDTQASWIMPGGNLHYGYYPDGSFGGKDYPYLTYNDLLAVNRRLGGNAALERLMASKKAWMDANGVSGYNK